MVLKNKFLICLLSTLMFLVCYNTKRDEFNLILCSTTDVHGKIFPYDTIEQKKTDYSLAHISHWLNKLRKNSNNEVVYLDNGDFFQGDPIIYYFNHIKKGKNIGVEVLKYLKIDAISLGNHEIDNGPEIYNKIAKELKVPFLAANALDAQTKEPYFLPYHIISRRGFKIAILGMVTTQITQTHIKSLWPDIIFEDIASSTKKWIPFIQKKEAPDLIVGLFHEGPKKGSSRATISDCPFTEINIDGFDIIFKGHDHRKCAVIKKSSSGKNVLIIGGSFFAKDLAQVTLKIKKENNLWSIKDSQHEIITFAGKNRPIDKQFLKTFNIPYQEALQYLNQKIGEFTTAISVKKALFGPSEYANFLHTVLFDIAKNSLNTPADVSFTAPLRLLLKLKKVYNRDLFLLYPYEDQISIIKMSGQEIKDLLEFFLSLWFNKMTSKQSNLLRYVLDSKGNFIKDSISGKYLLKVPFIHFLSASGIEFTVDLQKNIGNRVTIQKFSNNRPFRKDHMYNVACATYIISGGVNKALVNGAKIPEKDIPKRIVVTSPKNIRTYISEYIKQHKTITPVLLNNWKLVPEEWVQESREREYKMWFSEPI